MKESNQRLAYILGAVCFCLFIVVGASLVAFTTVTITNKDIRVKEIER